MDVRVVFMIFAVSIVIGITTLFVMSRKTKDDSDKMKKEIKKSGGSGAAEALSQKVSDIVPMSYDQSRKMDLMLQRAGLKFGSKMFVLVELSATVVALIIGAVISTFIPNLTTFQRIAFALLTALIGIVIPWFIVRKRQKKRRVEIEASLPSILELLAVVVGAGQTIEHGIKTVGERAEGPLAEEFAQVDIGITHFGYSVDEALQRMADRLGIPSVSLFVASVVQSIDAGSSVKQTLVMQAALATDNYYTALEEKSNKIRTKMIFPTVFLILPTVFIIVLTPMGMKLMEMMPTIQSMM